MKQKEQTAVDYLLNHIPLVLRVGIAEQIRIAKSIEKHQIELSFYDGGIDFQEKKELNNAEVPYYNDAEQYYNEQYGKNN